MEGMEPPMNTATDQEQGHVKLHMPYFMRKAHERKARAKVRATAEQPKIPIDDSGDAAAQPVGGPAVPSQ